MIAAILKRIRLFWLKRAIRLVEKSGLAVLQVKRDEGAMYIIAGNGTYVRYDKVKKGSV